MRLLFVHAHPDDEFLWTGVSIAHHVAAGDEVHVLTMTAGEEGEVIPADLAHLELPAGEERDPEGADPLAVVRHAELAAAMDVMGVASWTLLEGYRDSGMVGTASARHPRAFASAPVEEVATEVAALIERLGCDVVVTYDERGGYGHPDHIQTHRVTVAAVRELASPPRLFAVLTPRSWAVEDRAWAAAVPADRLEEWGVVPPPEPYAPELSVADDTVVTHATVDPGAVAVQARALACHRTQVRVLADDAYCLSNDVLARLSGREGFVEIDPADGRTVAGSGARRTGLEGR
ncbi:PIG-L family deacetylase [Luteipulveratus flavus]|uniref:PIG-L family deacetylase n=1 Tax=Luteipulveratus flavus TaxID=3031728 RepID=A0ABT6C9G4_9MICO|nr:PIG-L family deacetylase [Luteipulveratus sp. YIM 133296]MDF8264977.1 PIG-L family deacetylase [Luteipulveratus sp. YIM 133296]